MSGYDTNSWKTITGAPTVMAGRLVVDSGSGTGSAIHYVDLQKGEVIFDVNVPTAPGNDSYRVFGVSNAALRALLCVQAVACLARGAKNLDCHILPPGVHGRRRPAFLGVHIVCTNA